MVDVTRPHKILKSKYTANQRNIYMKLTPSNQNAQNRRTNKINLIKIRIAEGGLSYTQALFNLFEKANLDVARLN